MRLPILARAALLGGLAVFHATNEHLILADEAGNGLRALPAVQRRPQTFAPRATTARPAAAPVAESISPREVLASLNEAYRLSQTSQKEEDFSRIIEICTAAGEAELGEQEAQYARDLLAWAYNRRGETISSTAAELAQVGREEESAQLDAQALEDFTAAVEVDPTRWKAIHNRGVNYGLLGRHDEALADFTRVLELKPDYANAWFNRGEVHLEMGRYPAAAQDYSAALERVTTDAAAYFGRARAHAFMKQHEEALADFSQAMELEPTLPEDRIERGELHMRLADWKSAAADFRRAIELDPTSSRAYRSAAWLMATCPEAKYRHAKLALEAAEKAIALAEDEGTLDFTYLDTLAAASANAGEYAEAHDLLREALAQAPSAARESLKQRLASYTSDQPFRMRGKESGSPIRTVSTPKKTR
jgi:tetratricopeptide (TPR) repeat protein